MTGRPSAGRTGGRLLWVGSHLPDSSRSGVDARHRQMIEVLAGAKIRVVMWTEHGTYDGPAGRWLDSIGVERMVPRPGGRWDLQNDKTTRERLQDVIGGDWDAVIIAGSHLAARVIPQIRRLAPGTTTIVDFGTVRFPAAHDPDVGIHPDDQRLAQELAAIEGADAVVTATEQDRDVIRHSAPGLSTFAWAALGTDPAPSAGGGELLYIGDLFHHPNVQGLEWWMDAVAGHIEGRFGRPMPLRVIGRGSERYRALWNHPDKVELAGWRPDLGTELAAARIQVVPLTYATGTGGRIATALAAGVPVVTSAPAAWMLPSQLRELVRSGDDPAGIAEHVWRLMTDDGAWEDERRRVGGADIPALRRSQSKRFLDWLESRMTETKGDVNSAAGRGASRRPGTRRARRRKSRAS